MSKKSFHAEITVFRLYLFSIILSLLITFACRLVICELRLASLLAILHLVNDKIIEFRYTYFISFSFVSSIFWQLSDKTRHFAVSIILSLLYLCLQTCYLWASACILVCDLTSSERQNNWILILIFNFIQFRFIDILTTVR